MNYKIYNKIIAHTIDSQLDHEALLKKDTNSSPNPQDKPKIAPTAKNQNNSHNPQDKSTNIQKTTNLIIEQDKSYKKLYIGGGILTILAICGGILLYNKYKQKPQNPIHQPPIQPQNPIHQPQIHRQNHHAATNEDEVRQPKPVKIQSIKTEELSEENIFDHLYELDEKSIKQIIKENSQKGIQIKINQIHCLKCKNMASIIDNKIYVVWHGANSGNGEINENSEINAKQILFNRLFETTANNGSGWFKFETKDLNGKSYKGIKISELIKQQKIITAKNNELQKQIEREIDKYQQELQQLRDTRHEYIQSLEDDHDVNDIHNHILQLTKSNATLTSELELLYDQDIVREILSSIQQINDCDTKITNYIYEKRILHFMTGYQTDVGTELKKLEECEQFINNLLEKKIREIKDIKLSDQSHTDQFSHYTNKLQEYIQYFGQFNYDFCKSSGKSEGGQKILCELFSCSGIIEIIRDNVLKLEHTQQEIQDRRLQLQQKIIANKNKIIELQPHQDKLNKMNTEISNIKTKINELENQKKALLTPNY